MTPEEIRIRRRALTVLQRVLAAAIPAEGCALLLGQTLRSASPPPGSRPMAAPSLPLPCPPEAWPAGLALQPEPAAAGSSTRPLAPAGAVLPSGAGAPPEAPVTTWEVQLIWPCLNTWLPATERQRRFGIDPREQLLAQRWARERNLRVLGAAHSHPCSAAVPSATDRALTFPPALQLILSPLQHWTPACWWLERDGDNKRGEGERDDGVGETGEGAAGSRRDDTPVTARPLPWRMVD